MCKSSNYTFYINNETEQEKKNRLKYEKRKRVLYKLLKLYEESNNI